MRSTTGFLSAVAAAAMVLVISAPAKAVIVTLQQDTNASLINLTGQPSERAGTSGISVLNSPGSIPDAVGASVGVTSRYYSNVAADRGVVTGGSPATARNDADYTVKFSVTPQFTGTIYQVAVDTKILGELTLFNDGGGAPATSRISDVSGFLNGTPTAGLGLTGIAQTFSTATAPNDAQERNISASNSLILGTFSGPQSFTLRFTFFMVASSPTSGLGADEAAVRLGVQGLLSGASADDYPGPGDIVDRIAADDGHFVTLKATILSVPEPSGIVLAGLGALGLAVMRFRPKR